MDSLIDLHVHTTFSDGTLTPGEVVNCAADLGLKAISITDHDTTEGVFAAQRAAERFDLEVVPGIEISTRLQTAVHILGYYIDPNSIELRQALSAIVKERDIRNRRICERMELDGLPVSYDEMKFRFGNVIGRPHFATILVELGLAESVQDGFQRYLNRGKRYFQPRSFLSLSESIAVILRSGGLPVLAHPFQYRLMDSQLRELIVHCIDLGLKGIECRYSGYSQEQSRYLLGLSEEYRLKPTGGSDFHGLNKPQIQLGSGTGDLQVPYSYLRQIKEELNIAL